MSNVDRIVFYLHCGSHPAWFTGLTCSLINQRWGKNVLYKSLEKVKRFYFAVFKIKTSLNLMCFYLLRMLIRCLSHC